MYTIKTHINLFVCSRQCALAALNDVRQYLTDEGGQVAVRKTSFEHK